MNGNFQEQLKQIMQKFKKASKRMLVLLALIPFIIIAILGASVYQIFKHDGTFDEGDWANTQYAASEYANSTSIDENGNINTTMTAEALWQKLLDEDSRVTYYLDGPEELAKLMNAQLVTQYLDTRENPDEEIDWDKVTDINSTEVQGIIKLKRATDDGQTKTMTYVDPETFQSYIDSYNSSGSESDRERALSHFTLDKTVTGTTVGGELQVINGVSMTELTTSGRVTFYNGDGSPTEGGPEDKHGQPLADGKCASKELAPDESVIYIETQESGDASFANGKFFYVCDTGGGLQSNQIDVYANVGQSELNTAPYGSTNSAKIYLVEEDVTWEEYQSKYYNKTVGDNSTSSDISTAIDNNIENANNQTDDATAEVDESQLLYWPTQDGEVTSEYGGEENHKGIDIGVSEGTNVYSCEDGTVINKGNSDSSGRWVEIDHGNGYTSKYTHNSEIKVDVGEVVEKGQLIALSGSTGSSEQTQGAHLHFQIEYNEEPVDPMSFKYNNDMGTGTGGFGYNDFNDSNATETTYTAKVATWTETTETVESNDPNVEEYSNTTYNMTTTEINYQDMVSGYTMPFDYLWVFLVMTQDKEFVFDLADLVYNSEIEITVHDNLDVNTKVDTYNYTRREKVQTTNANVTVSYDGTSSSFSKTDGFTAQEYDTPCETTKTTIKKVNTLDICLTKANVWIVDYERKYEYQGDQQGSAQGGDASSLANVDYGDPESISEDRNGDGESFRQEKQAEYTSAGHQNVSSSLDGVSCNVWHGVFDITETITTTVDTKMYTSTPGEVKEKTDKNSDEENFVTVFLKDSSMQARTYIMDAPQWLFDMLEGNDSTKEMVDLTKYLLYKATGRSFGVTEFDFSIFYPQELQEAGSDDYIVHTEKSSPEIVITDKDTLIKAFQGAKGAGTENLVEYVDAFLKFQEEYKVNAVFAAAVTINECGAGTNCQIGGNNWYSIKDGSGGWRSYSSPRGAIKDFFELIANGSYYFQDNKFTVSEIGMVYCEDADKPGGWIESVKAYMTNMFNAVGIYPTSSESGSGVESFMSALEKYSQTVQSEKRQWTYSNTNNSDTFNQAIKNDNRKVNCATTVIWALKDIGVLEKNQRIYMNLGTPRYINGAEKNIKKYAQVINAKGKTAKALVETGELKRGDICGWSGITHTNVYAGNKQWYDSGHWDENGVGSGGKYFTTFGPISPKTLNNKWKVKTIIRLNADSGGDFLAVAKRCHDYVRDNGFTYLQTPHNTIPIDESGYKTIDCSSYVSWVCYEYGYKDFKGSQESSDSILSKAREHNWIIKDASEAVAGDILQRSGHVEIYAGNGKAYNCGGPNSIKADISNSNPSRFTYAITVTPPK
mgnify:CR=1 FL=1